MATILMILLLMIQQILQELVEVLLKMVLPNLLVQLLVEPILDFMVLPLILWVFKILIILNVKKTLSWLLALSHQLTIQIGPLMEVVKMVNGLKNGKWIVVLEFWHNILPVMIKTL